MGGDGPLGHGYVRLFSEMLTACEPEKDLRIINKGISGDRVTGLEDRWSNDVLRLKPDWLSIKIGINDLHSALGNDPYGVDPETFRNSYAAILAKTHEALPACQIVLIDPFYLALPETKDDQEKMVLKMLPEYLQVVEEMGKRYQARHIPMHQLFQQQLDYRPPSHFCPEPVHPNQSGHMVIATAVYEALER